jgi:transposase-like protein
MQRRIKAETKMLIVREHLENHVLLADLAEKYHVNVNSIINWKKKLFESAALVFDTSRDGTNSGSAEATEQLEQEIRKKDAVIAQLAEEVMTVKKSTSGGR